MKNLHFAFFFSLLIYIPCSSQGIWTSYSTQQIVYDVYVDGQDVWVGTLGGLTKTNIESGEFQAFLPENSPLKGAGINEIEKAPDGSLWFGSVNTGVYQLKDGVWKHYYEDVLRKDFPYLDNQTVEDLQILPNGDVWFFVDNGNDYLFRIRNGEVESFDFFTDDYHAFFVADENTVYLTGDHEIHKYDIEQEKITKWYDSVTTIINAEDYISHLIADENGTIFIPTSRRILKLENGVIEQISDIGTVASTVHKDALGNIYFEATYTDPENPTDIHFLKYDGETISHYYTDDLPAFPFETNFIWNPRLGAVGADGSLFAYYYSRDKSERIFKLSDNEWMPIQTEIYPMMTDRFQEVVYDCEGNLWMTGYERVDVLYKDGTWDYFEFDVSENFSWVSYRLTADQSTCDVWLAISAIFGDYNAPVLVKFTEGKVEYFLEHGFAAQSLKSDNNGKTYISTRELGFGYMEDDDFYAIEGLDDDVNVFSIDIDKAGKVYLATGSNGLFMYNEGFFQNFQPPGSVNNSVEDIYIDDQDMVWVNTFDGMMRFDGEEWQDYTDQFGPNSFNGMVQDKKGNFWVASFREGLYYWDMDNRKHFTTLNSNLIRNSVRSVDLDKSGNLLIAQSYGVSVVTDLSSLSTKDVSNNVLIYPNPAQYEVAVEVEAESSFEIVDISGRLVQKGSFEEGRNSLNLSLNPGIYFLTVKEKSGLLSTQKLVIE